MPLTTCIVPCRANTYRRTVLASSFNVSTVNHDEKNCKIRLRCSLDPFAPDLCLARLQLPGTPVVSDNACTLPANSSFRSCSIATNHASVAEDTQAMRRMRLGSQ